MYYNANKKKRLVGRHKEAFKVMKFPLHISVLLIRKIVSKSFCKDDKHGTYLGMYQHMA